MLLTHFILAITIIISVIAFNDRVLFLKMAFSPYEIRHKNQWTRSVTHAFIHADFTHLAFNMFVFWQFGEILELKMKYHFGTIGGMYFIVLYLGGILFSTLLAYIRHQNNPAYLSVGASGAVSSVIFATLIMFPSLELRPFLFPFMIPGFIFGLLYIMAEIIMDKLSNKNIAHDAHFLGAIFGIVFLSLLDIEILKHFVEYVKMYFS